MLTETILLWAAVIAYAVGTILFISGFVFRKSLMRIATVVVLIGLIPHVAATIVRWIRVGHGPYLGFFEVVSVLALTVVATFGVIVWRNRRYEPLGVVIMPIVFLMMGASMLAPRADETIPPTLASPWLIIHIIFAMLSYAAFIASFAFAVAFLLRDRGVRTGARWEAMLDKLPAQDIVDDLSFKFIEAGFVFLAIMIVAGAIWANEAWGRYWGWDPIETWSLISWLLYAAYLHTRLTLGWRGRRSAWFAVAALPVVVFALIGVPIAYNSIHSAYLQIK